MITKKLTEVRLTALELQTIENAFQATFLASDHIWLFGSRVDKSKKGGDIDLYIETSIKDLDEAMAMESKFVQLLWDELGEQKIDVVLNRVGISKSIPIYNTVS